MKNKTKMITNGALIAAMYVVLTLVSATFGLSSGVIQVRISEALCILPFFMPEAVWGLFAGCIISNLITGCALWDVVFGSIATLIGAVVTAKLKNRWLLPVPAIISNMVIIPLVLIKVYGLSESWWYLVLTVGAGEIISCGILGQFLYSAWGKVIKRKS
jgi:uncharacterized membrane protein